MECFEKILTDRVNEMIGDLNDGMLIRVTWEDIKRINPLSLTLNDVKVPHVPVVCEDGDLFDIICGLEMVSRRIIVTKSAT